MELLFDVPVDPDNTFFKYKHKTAGQTGDDQKKRC